jgi:YedE family putative selenium metabolism protein
VKRSGLIIVSGLVIGALSILLMRMGNPASMGVCVACFIRDIAGGLGLHRAAAVQYLRPEVPGFILGATIVSSITGEFRSRGGSSPIIRFVLGFLMIIGALVFLGCPLRMVLRLAAGDLNALVGLFGFAAGVLVGVVFLRKGFSLGRSTKQPRLNGAVMPGLAVTIVVLAVAAPAFVFFSQSGPGSMHAPLLMSLGAGLVVGIIAQRSRLCMAGGIRDMFLIKSPHLLVGSLAIIAVALVLNIIGGNFKLGFEGQPIAHTDGLWNFLGMGLVGLGATLLGGCPLRQCILSGEGDTDAAITVLGMLAGAAFAHNFGTAASAAGVPVNGKWAVAIGYAIALTIGYLGLPRAEEGGNRRAA